MSSAVLTWLGFVRLMCSCAWLVLTVIVFDFGCFVVSINVFAFETVWLCSLFVSFLSSSLFVSLLLLCCFLKCSLLLSWFGYLVISRLGLRLRRWMCSMRGLVVLTGLLMAVSLCVSASVSVLVRGMLLCYVSVFDSVLGGRLLVSNVSVGVIIGLVCEFDILTWLDVASALLLLCGSRSLVALVVSVYLMFLVSGIMFVTVSMFCVR